MLSQPVTCLLVLMLISLSPNVCVGTQEHPKSMRDSKTALIAFESDAPLKDVWCGQNGFCVAVGWELVLIRSSEGWLEDKNAPEMCFESVWGSGEKNIFTVSARGGIAHYDGELWRVFFEDDGPIHGDSKFFAVWGSSESDVFAVGLYGEVLHFNGRSWITMDSGTTDNLFAVHGTSASNVVAVGSRGTVIRYNGDSWQRVSNTFEKRLNAVLVESETRFFVAGGYGSAGIFDNGQWKAINTSYDLRFTDLAYDSIGGLLALTDERPALIVRYNGHRWATLYQAPTAVNLRKFEVTRSGTVMIACGTRVESTKGTDPYRLPINFGEILEISVEDSK